MIKRRLLLSFSILLTTAVFFIFQTRENPTPSSGQKYGPLTVPPAEQIDIERKRDQPHLAMLQEFEMTKDDNLGYPPTQRMVEAYAEIKKRFAEQPDLLSAIPGVKWTERGPDNVGGRTRALMFDPNDPTARKVWAGSVSGGLWFIDDITSSINSWQQETGIMTNLAISTITYDPTNTQTFYLGTGQGFTGIVPGAGIWKSPDGGSTWNQLASTANSDFSFIQKVKVTPQGTILAATTTGIHRSVDGGATWTNVFTGRMADIEIASNGVIYVSRGVNSTGGIYKSTNDGLIWSDITPVTGGNRTEIAVAPSDPDVIYAVSDGGSGSRDVEYFMKSVDGGANWVDITTPLYSEQGSCSPGSSHFTRGQAFFDLVLAVHPEQSDVVIAGGIDLHRTMDGGQTWELMTYWNGQNCDDFAHADQHEIQFRPGHPNSLIAGNDGGVDYSADAGNAEDPDFERRIRGYNTVLFYYSAMVNELGSNSMLGGAQDNGTQRFDSFGINSTHDATGGDGGFCFINPNDPSIQITSFVFNTYDLSTDGGLSFNRIANDRNSGRFINPTDVDFQTGTLFSAAGTNQLGRITGLFSTPGSLDKISISIGGRISAVKVSPHTANRIFIGTSSGGGGRIFIIDDALTGAPSVTEITGNLDGNRGSFLRSIDVGASDDQLLITFSNFGANSVYETQDGGTSWVNKEDNLPDIPVRWALYNPKNRQQVLLATNLGVWSTDDITAANPNWEATNNGLASVRVDHLNYRTSDEMIAAATFGRGLFTSDVFASTVKADFKTDQLVGYVGLPVNFEDASLLHGDSWSWDFGDGNTSNDQNPSHTFQSPGTYDISLTIANGVNIETKPAYVTILPVQSTPYLAADGGDFESNPEHFTSRALLNGVDLWERGVPGNALTTLNSGVNAWKTKLSEDITDLGFDHKSALYTPAFDLSNLTQDYTLSMRLSLETLPCNLPIALQAHYSLDGGINWQTLGSSNGSPGDVNWYNRGPNFSCSIDTDLFDDKMGWTRQSGENLNLLTKTKLNFLAGQPNVSFRFVIAVSGGASGGGNPYAVDGFMIDDFEILANDPTADFDANPTSTFINEDIQFSYTSNGADTFLWNFGDGATSTDQNPIHAYANSGLYTVSLTITANGQPVSLEKEDFISIQSAKSLPYLLSDGGNFEVNTGDFRAINTAGTPFELGVSGIAGKSGTVSGNNVWVTDKLSPVYLNNSQASLITPLFRFNDPTKVHTLEFKSKFSFEDTWDGFIVNYSIDNGNTWTKLNDNLEEGWYTTTSNPSAIWGSEVPIFSGSTNDEFRTFSTDVSFLAPNDVVFEFLFRTDPAAVDIGVAIDDFQITLSEAQPLNAGFSIEPGSGCAGQVIVFTNTTTGTGQNYLWDFGDNAVPATATGAGPHTVTYTAAGTSSVRLDVSNVFGQSDFALATDAILTGALHTPTFNEEDNGDRSLARLVASQGDSYQWYLNFIAIDGATNQILLAEDRGNYEVEVTIDGCTAISAQQNIITSTPEDLAFQKAISIFPNPVSDVLKIQISNSYIGELNLLLHSSNGSTIQKKAVQKLAFDFEYEMITKELNQGVYLLEIISDGARSIKRVVKQN